jgi:hypothetical protein
MAHQKRKSKKDIQYNGQNENGQIEEGHTIQWPRENGQIKEGHTIQWPRENGQNDKQRTTKHSTEN